MNPDGLAPNPQMKRLSLSESMLVTLFSISQREMQSEIIGVFMSDNYAEYLGSNGKHQHTIQRLEDNSIKVIPASTKAQLRLIAKHCGFDYETSWTTQQFGAKLIDFLHAQDASNVVSSDAKKAAIFNGVDGLYKHTIEQSANNIITITPDSTKAILRLIFADMNEDYDKNWNTQTMGAKLIDLLNGELHQDDADDIDESIDEDEKANENWEWWLNAGSNMRFLLLYELERQLGILSDNNCETDEDGAFYIYHRSIEQLNQEANDALMPYLVNDYIVELEHLSVTEASQSEVGSWLVGFCFEHFDRLAYLSELKSLSFKHDNTLSFIPHSLAGIKNLTHLDLSDTSIGADDPEEDIENLFNIAKSLQKLLILDLRNTEITDHLTDEQKDELQELLPKCDIMFD